ncbi:malate dehydrogenase [Candidatus Woesearchaeota archaeon]|nr:malate dehydrogenase [Candidatus Woesearchaeota archaeon]
MKISIIGAGMVGSTSAQRIAEKGLADELVLLDIIDSVKGKALDIQESAPIGGFDTKVKGTTDYNDIDGSDIVIVTAGFPRMPGMSREDLLEKNSGIIKDVAANIRQHAPGSIVIIVTNPLDIMAYILLKETGFSRNKVIGMAGILDTTRFASFIAEELGASPKDVKALVLGSHGDTMVPVIRETEVGGKKLTELLGPEKIETLVERTRKGGAEVISYLKKGSAFYAPSSSITRMVEAIANNTLDVLPCSVYLEGEYGYEGIFLGVPVRLGNEGVAEIVDISLDDGSKKSLDSSAEAIKNKLKEVK